MTNNKGTGAGGAQTNINGKKFERKVCNENRLNEYEKYYISKSKNKYNHVIIKQNEDSIKIYGQQNSFKALFRKYNEKYPFQSLYEKIVKNNKINFSFTEINTVPDEFYITIHSDARIVINILEVKEQSRQGSVIDKLLNGDSKKNILRRKLQKMNINTNINYGYCVNNYLKNIIMSDEKDYVEWREEWKEKNIKILFGDDKDYFDKLDEWLNN